MIKLALFAKRFLEEAPAIQEYIENSTPNSEDLTGNAADVLSELMDEARSALE